MLCLPKSRLNWESNNFPYNRLNTVTGFHQVEARFVFSPMHLHFSTLFIRLGNYCTAAMLTFAIFIPEKAFQQCSKIKKG